MYLIFSSFKKCITSLIQWEKDGGACCFHLKRIKRLARSVVKAIMTQALAGKAASDSSGVKPKRAQIGSGSNLVPNISLKALKILFQKVERFGHCQNMCTRSAGWPLHRGHNGLTFG